MSLPDERSERMLDALLGTSLDVDPPADLRGAILAAVAGAHRARPLSPAWERAGVVCGSAVLAAIVVAGLHAVGRDGTAWLARAAVGLAGALGSSVDPLASFLTGLVQLDWAARLVGTLAEAGGTVLSSSGGPLLVIAIPSLLTAGLLGTLLLRKERVRTALLGAALLVGPHPLLAQEADTAAAALEELDRQLDEAGEEGAPNTELWEEYQRYGGREKNRDDLRRSRERVEIGGSIHVRETELIEGDVVAVGGSVTVAGHVEGDVVAVGGSVILEDGAVVEGDVVAVGGRVQDLGDAEVSGERVSIDLGLDLGRWFGGWDSRSFSLGPPKWMSFSFSLVWLGAMLLIACLLYALAGGRLEVMSRRIDDEPGQSFLVGLLGAFATPFAFLVTVILLAITLIGILLIPVLVIGVGVMILAGFVATSLAVGRRLVQARSAELPSSRGPYFFLLVGFLALHALDILKSVTDLGGSFLTPFSLLFGVLGFFVLVCASILGYGALLTSRFGTQPSGQIAAALPPLTPPPPPPSPPTSPPALPPPAPEPPGSSEGS